MRKAAIENVAKALPAFFKNAAHYLKNNFDENGQEILGGATGTAGVITKLFGQPLIDKYFQNLTEKKLENFAFNIYLKSALIQAGESLQEIENSLDDELSPEIIFKILNETIKEEVTDFDPSELLMIFQPKYHPVVLFVRNNYERVLKEIKTTQSNIKAFLKHFNDNIESQITKEFGEDYEKHIKETEEYRLKDNETEFLWDITKLSKIGLQESENLKYEEAFGEWKRVSVFRARDDEQWNEKKYEEEEKTLQPIEKLIEGYFSNQPDNHLEKILFIVADFGKGKSVFLKRYAAKLAKSYLETKKGYFPVYFNLRNFKNYSSEPRLGIIGDYLETKYSIKLDNDYFKKKRYAFLIDSLDESGELNRNSIDRVISSIKAVQGIDKTIYKTNCVIVTSRPFDDGLEHHLKAHEPQVLKNEEGREIPHFISLYGFKKEQFNNWLGHALKSAIDLDKMETKGFSGKIVKGIKSNKEVDVYKEMVEANTLSRSELRRPIFAYMTYQLILHNIDFLTLGKIGVYLSFLNLLTRDAKHIHDPNYHVDLKEEFVFRNILHATAALWMYERQQGKPGTLKKADICRVLEGEKKETESDKEILERYKNKGVIEIQFLSHSYFGESDNVLHFQHQSFAEILLAEYYLKVFVKYALDKEFSMEEARTKLMLGEPTEQTVEFLRELLKLLRETSLKNGQKNLIEKRKLLFPLMASLATEKYNNLFSNDIYYSWYEKFDILENQVNIPPQSVEEWCIDQEKLNKIIELAKACLESKMNYLLVRGNPKTALYDKELLAIENHKVQNLPPDIDRWLALLVGNELFNNIRQKQYFNQKIENFEHFFDLIKNWNYAFNMSSPLWASDLFRGIDMRGNVDSINLDHSNLSNLDFSYSHFNQIRAFWSTARSCLFNYCTFDGVTFNFSDLSDSEFHNIKLGKGKISLFWATISPGIPIPDQLANSLQAILMYTQPSLFDKTYYSDMSGIGLDMFTPLRGLLLYGLKHELFTKKEIMSWFKFASNESKEFFHERIAELEKFKTKRKKK